VSRTSTRDTFAPGQRVGDYNIERELQYEETGIVYLGTHVVLPRQAAIKVMHASSQYLRSMAVQMLREACILEALSHPGIPRVYECGVLPDRRPWTALEHRDGPTLASLIDGVPLALADLTIVLRDVGDVLHHAHSRGVVHRSLSPEAIVRTTHHASSVCVRDWGDAHTLDTEVRVSVNARDDIHALGVIAFRALTGTMPDRRVSTAERCPTAPAELTELIDQMLAVDPDLRPMSSEVRDRTRWLADTIVPLVVEKRRWTPPHGLDDAIPIIEDEPTGFAVRIGSRTKTQ
jgi:serine/threonine protein kinase